MVQSVRARLDGSESCVWYVKHMVYMGSEQITKIEILNIYKLAKVEKLPKVING